MADIVMKVDDLDGTPIPADGGGAVSFGFRGRHYEIDLTSEHEDELAALLRPYLEKAKEVTPLFSLNAEPPLAESDADLELAKLLQAEARRNLQAGRKPYDTIAARAWLSEQGIDFNKMGPLKKEYRVIYERHFGLPAYDFAPQHAE